jgi:hypothetical protein
LPEPQPDGYDAAVEETAMSTMRAIRRAVIGSAIAVAGVTLAAAGSTYYDHGKAVPLSDSYACTQPDMLNDGKLVTIVAFSNGPMDKAAASRADDPCRELGHQVGTKFAVLVELKIKYDGTAYNVQIYDANGTTSRSDPATLKLTTNDGKRIEGTYVSKNASYKTSPDHAYFDLTFALDVAHGK